jgi:hypothetical protein
MKDALLGNKVSGFLKMLELNPDLEPSPWLPKIIFKKTIFMSFFYRSTLVELLKL